jgi:hypothetical protein
LHIIWFSKAGSYWVKYDFSIFWELSASTDIRACAIIELYPFNL